MTIPTGLLDRINHLAPLPITAQRLTAAVGDQEIPMAEIAKIVEHDQAVAANVLRVANSPLYAGKFPIRSVRDAVVRLGLNTVLTVVLDNHLTKYRVEAPMYDLSENELWLHGAAASLAVPEMIRELPKVQIAPETAIAALVHDIGKLVMVRYMKADVRSLLDLCKQKGILFVEAEAELLGCDHAEVGGAIARHWKFPESISEAIEFHHKEPAEPSVMLDVVMVANLVAKTIGVGLGAEGLNFELGSKTAKRLGLGLTVFCRICAQTAGRVQVLKETHRLN